MAEAERGQRRRAEARRGAREQHVDDAEEGAGERRREAHAADSGDGAAARADDANEAATVQDAVAAVDAAAAAFPAWAALGPNARRAVLLKVADTLAAKGDLFVSAMAAEIGIASGEKGSGIRVSSTGVKYMPKGVARGAKGGPGAPRRGLEGGRVARAPGALVAPLRPYFGRMEASGTLIFYIFFPEFVWQFT